MTFSFISLFGQIFFLYYLRIDYCNSLLISNNSLELLTSNLAYVNFRSVQPEKGENKLKDMGKAIATVATWGGVALFSYLFHSFGILDGEGAAWMVIGAFLLTVLLWKL